MNSIENCNALFEKAFAFCMEHQLIQPNDRVIAAVSGGADSMALLLFFQWLKKRVPLFIGCVHVNHGIRNEEADEDERFVKEYCTCNGIELYTYDLRKMGVVVPEHPSEEWAREQRYACFDALALREGALIATAHTANDQAETLLFRLGRGCGLSGARGILSKRGCYIRPFLNLSRQETETICRACGVDYCVDSTNEQDQYARNRLRHHVIPEMVRVTPGAVGAMTAFCERAATAFDYLSIQAAALLKQAQLHDEVSVKTKRYDSAVLLSAHPAVRTIALEQMVSAKEKLESRDLARIQNILQNGGAVQLNKNTIVRCEGGTIYCADVGVTQTQQSRLKEGITTFGEYRFETIVLPYNSSAEKVSVNKKYLNYYADYDKIISIGPIVRNRLAGDVFSSGKRKISKPLRKWFSEWGVPKEERDRLPIVASGNRVIWVYGVGFAAGFEPTTETQHVINMKW